MNGEIAASGFSASDCVFTDTASICLEPLRVELRSDFGIDYHYRVHAGMDLDRNERAREAWVRVLGQGEEFRLDEELERSCQGRMRELMREHGLRVGVVHYTVGGVELTRGIIDLAACLNWEEERRQEDSGQVVE